jgi:hypothetical protein
MTDGHAARQGLPVQQGLDLGLAGAVLAVGGARLVLGDRHPQRRAVHPDRPAVQQQRPGGAQCVGQLPGGVGGEADQVDDRIGAQVGDAPAEDAGLVFRVPVHGGPGHRAPLRTGVVGLAGAAAQRDHLMAAADQPRYQTGPDMPGGPITTIRLILLSCLPAGPGME